MGMLLEQIDLTKQYNYTLVLTKKNKTPICILSEAYSRTLNVKMDDINSLTFTVPYYIEDSVSHLQVKNPNYNYVLEENMVLLKAGDPSNPDFEAYFIIKGIDEETDKLSKSVRCVSRESMLNKDTITFDGKELQLQKDSVNIAYGVFDVLTNETTWKAGYIDTSAKVEPPSIGNVNKYRWFDSISKPWLQFLREDVQSSFNIVLFYDTKNKLINVFNRDSYGTHTGIILTEENYIKNLKKKTNSENIVTRLDVAGRDGVTFESINPYGNTYVYNYDYFKSNGQMSTELINALNRYDILVNLKNVDFQNLVNQINDINSQITVKQSELDSLNEQLKALLAIQNQYRIENDNVNLPTATTNVNNKVAEIGQKQNEISTLNSQIDTLNTQKTAISNAIDKNNATDSQGKIFNDALLEELEDFTYTEPWNNDYYDSTQLKQLYNAGVEKLKDWSVPPIEFDVDSVDLFGTFETQHWWGKIKLGDFVRFYSERLKLNTDARIVEYTYNIDSNDLKFTFSNKDKKLDDTRSIANTIRKTNESSKILNVKKLEWNEIVGTKNAVDNFLNNALDLARQNVVSQLGRNKISINEYGIFVIDADNENHQIALLSSLIAFTSDGWQTASTAIDSSGVYAKYLVGQIILGQQLFIQDETGQLSIIGNLLTIKDDQNRTRVRLGKYDATNNRYGLQLFDSTGNNTVLDERGIVQTIPWGSFRNLDTSHPLVDYVPLPSNLLSIRKAEIFFKLLPFRVDVSTVASGGSSTPTSSVQPQTTTNQFLDSNGNIIDSNNFSYLTDGANATSPHAHSFRVPHGHTIPSHSHTVSVPSHSHPLNYGVYEGQTLSGVYLYVNGTKVGDLYTSDTTIDITSYLNSGYNEIKFVGTSIGLIQYSMYTTCFVSF